MRLLAFATALVLTAPVLGATPNIDANTREPTSIAAEDLRLALKDLAAQRGLQFVYRAQLVDGIRTSGTHGNFTVGEALTRLLQGTGLTYRFLGKNAITIVAIQPTQQHATSSRRPASAATGAAVDSVPPDKSSAAAATQGNTGLRLETIVVTAEKRTQNIQDVPASVFVLTGGTLTAWHAVSLQDMAGYIPGLNIEPGGSAGLETVALDGVAPTSPTATARVYIDDVPLGSSSGFVDAASITPDLMPYDIERVEVLAGPQGTLYGANAMAGAIKYVLIKPSLSNFAAQVGADASTISSGGGVGDMARGMVNIPVLADELAVRASEYEEYTPGYINDIQTGWKHDNDVHQSGGRVAALWKAAPNLTIEATALYQDTLQNNDDIVEYDATTRQPFPGGSVLSNAWFVRQFSRIHLQLYDLTENWGLGWANLTSSSSYQSFRTSFLSDETAALQPVITALFGTTSPVESTLEDNPQVGKFTQEVRLASPGNRILEWMAGGYFTHETTTQTQNAVAQPPLGIGQLGYEQLFSTYTEYAAFGNVTWRMTDRLDLGGGLRYSYNQQHYIQPMGGVLYGSAPWVPASVVDNRSRQGVTTWDITPRYHIDPNNLVYVRIATGYQPGAPNTIPPGTPNVPTSYESSTLIDYEAGLKSVFLDGSALTDISVYDIDWNRIQVPLVFTSCDCTAVGNGGTARSVGTSLNAGYSPISGLRLGVTVAYSNPVITQPIAVIGAPAGSRLPYSPRWAYSLTADYTVPIDARWTLDAGAGFRHAGSSWSTVQGSVSDGVQDAYLEPSYDTLDLHAGVSDGSWRFSLYGHNITNDLYLRSMGLDTTVAFLTPIAFSGSISQPRTLGISVDKSF